MYNNLSSFSIQSPLSSTITTDPSRTSPPPIHHQLFVATIPPVMRSRVTYHHGLPDQPDRAGMRERRAQSEMTVRALQRIRGVEPATNSHAEVLEAYGYRQLGQWMMHIPANVMHAMQAANEALGDAVSFRIGPPGAQAAPAPGNPPSVNNFMKKFSANFEINLSPAARNSADMRGMVIVIGEHHFDPSIQSLVKEVMLEFRRVRGDRFFLESDNKQVCRERVEKYQMQPNDCELLEKNSVACAELSAIREEVDRYLRDSVSYLKKHVTSAREDSRAQNLLAYLDFIRQHEKNLPASKLDAYRYLQGKVSEMKVRFVNAATKYRPQRDRQMADSVIDRRSETGLNFMVIGASHVIEVAKHMQDLPLMLMVPRALIKQVPANKDEL